MLVQPVSSETLKKLQEILSEKEYKLEHELFLLEALSYFPPITVIGSDILEYLEVLGSLSIKPIEKSFRWEFLP